MRVVAHDPFVNLERAGDLGVPNSDLETLLRMCDAITLHVPLSDENRRAHRTRGNRRDAAGRHPGQRGAGRARGRTRPGRGARQRGSWAPPASTYTRPNRCPPTARCGTPPTSCSARILGASTFEAQRQVSRQIAVAVRDALLENDYSGALNAPFEAEDRDGAGAIMELGRCLGRLLAGLDDAPPRRIEVGYGGPRDGVLGPLAASVAVGFLEMRVEPPLNVVNALSIAAERGLEIARVRTQAVGDYTNYVELCATSAPGDERIVGGALMGTRMEPRIVRVGVFRVDTVPRGTCLLIRNRDQPGVIGAVGTVLGAANANIAEYHLARRRGGGRSLGVVRIDGQLPPDILRDLVELDAVDEVQQISFD